jgi:hypothetical protein
VTGWSRGRGIIERVANRKVWCSRYIHSLEAGDEIEVRGPIMTTRIELDGLEEIDLASPRSPYSYVSFLPELLIAFTPTPPLSFLQEQVSHPSFNFSTSLNPALSQTPLCRGSTLSTVHRGKVPLI